MVIAVKIKFNLGQNHLKIQLCYADILNQRRLGMYSMAECLLSMYKVLG